MIEMPNAFINCCPGNGDVKTIVNMIAYFRLRGRRAQFSWTKQCQWIGKSRRTLAKLHKSEAFLTCVKKIRRGKKQTNLYNLAPWLWERLKYGRRIPHPKNPQGEEQRPETRAPSKLMELFRAELGKIAKPIP